MQLTYRDGKTADDSFFDVSIEDQRARCAAYMALHPDPKYWPIATIDNLIGIRRHEGESAFSYNIARMNGAVR